jgi:hypothetical protein
VLLRASSYGACFYRDVPGVGKNIYIRCRSPEAPSSSDPARRHKDQWDSRLTERGITQYRLIQFILTDEETLLSRPDITTVCRIHRALDGKERGFVAPRIWTVSYPHSATEPLPMGDGRYSTPIVPLKFCGVSTSGSDEEVGRFWRTNRIMRFVSCFSRARMVRCNPGPGEDEGAPSELAGMKRGP